MNPNIRPSDRLTLLVAINPVSQGVGSVSTGWLSAADFHSFLAVIDAGVLGAAATLDGKLEQANTSGGGAAKDITGKAITQLTKAGADDNKQVMVNLRSAELDVNNGFAWFRLTLTVAAAASLLQAAVYGLDARFQPAAHATTVDEVV
jgi:hypothetical protein